jgi:hypothetical protein
MSGWKEKYALPRRVLEAGGSIESRCLAKNLPNFTDQYVFTKEQLEKFMENLKNELTKQTS